MPGAPVYLSRPLPEAALERLRAAVALEWNREDRAATRGELLAGVSGKRGLLCFVCDRVDRELLAAGPALHVVANFGVGVDHIDLVAARERGVVVTNTPGVLTEATADLTFALLLATARRLLEGDRLARSGAWGGWGPLELLGADVCGAVLGVVGLGRIGRAVARRAAAFGMSVCYWNRGRLPPAEEEALGVAYRDLDTLCAEVDFLSLHAAYSPATHHLIDRRRLRLLRPSAILVNTARGALVDESALVDALAGARLAGAGLDVYEREPEIPPALRALDNVVLLPHLGSGSVGARTSMGLLAVDNLLAVLAGRPAPSRVV